MGENVLGDDGSSFALIGRLFVAKTEGVLEIYGGGKMERCGDGKGWGGIGGNRWRWRSGESCRDSEENLRRTYGVPHITPLSLRTCVFGGTAGCGGMEAVVKADSGPHS